jgi:arsenite methyltransferase
VTEYLTSPVELDSPEAASTFDELPLWSAIFGHVLLKHVPLRANFEVLDVGCGTGFPLLELAQRLGPTCRVHGIDPWTAALDRARLKARRWGVRNVDIREGDAAALPYPDKHFGLVVSNLGVNNFSDPRAVFAECRRVLEPKARLVLTTNPKGHMQELYEVFEATLEQSGCRDRLEAFHQHVDHRLSPERLAAVLAELGLRVARVHQESAHLRFVDGSAFLRHSFIKVGFLDGWRGVVGPEDETSFFAHLEANLNRRAEARGELDLTIPVLYMEAERSDAR